MKGGMYVPRCVWDMLPAYWTAHEEYFDRKKWRESEVARCSDLVERYDEVVHAFDGFLEKHGYVREKELYRVKSASEETVTFFCHFGITCVLLSHLWNVSPFILWHGLALAPTSVTEVVTEERQKGIAYFRGLRLGIFLTCMRGMNRPPLRPGSQRFMTIWTRDTEPVEISTEKSK